MSNAPVPAAAEGMPALSRRTFLATTSVAVAASLPGCSLMSPAAASILKAAPYVPAGPALVSGPDADLRTVCGFAHRLAEAYEACCAADEDDPTLDDLADIEREAVEWIAKTPATSPAGLVAKAEAMRLRLPRDTAGNLALRYAGPSDMLAWSLADDVARLAGHV
jgi:hypothetical protein